MAQLWQEDRFIGVLFSTVTVAELSNLLAASPEGEDSNTFIIYDQDYVIAHPVLARNPPELGFDHRFEFMNLCARLLVCTAIVETTNRKNGACKRSAVGHFSP